MRGQRALEAEVFLRAHEAAAEECGPVTVGSHSRGQRVFWRDQPVRECEPIGCGVRRQWRQRRQTAGGDEFFRLQELTAMMPMRRARVARGTLLHHERRRQRWTLSTQVLNRLSLAGEFRSNRDEVSPELLNLCCGTRSLRSEQRGFDSTGQEGCLDGRRIGRDRDAEVADAGGVITFEEHSQREGR